MSVGYSNLLINIVLVTYMQKEKILRYADKLENDILTGVCDLSCDRRPNQLLAPLLAPDSTSLKYGPEANGRPPRGNRPVGVSKTRVKIVVMGNYAYKQNVRQMNKERRCRSGVGTLSLLPSSL